MALNWLIFSRKITKIAKWQGIRLQAYLCDIFSRGGVEDTKLEAKAKDTKKSEAKAKDSTSEDRPSRGQGQECSRPRTRDTGAGVLQKKIHLKKNFAGVT